MSLKFLASQTPAAKSPKLRIKFLRKSFRSVAKRKTPRSQSPTLSGTSEASLADPAALTVTPLEAIPALSTYRWWRRLRRMWATRGLAVALALSVLPDSRALRPGDCEVCISYLGRFYQDLKDRDVTFSPATIEEELIKFCREARGKENRLCYYIGATDDAATKIINEVSKPLAHHIPVEKICEKLKKKDSQICELKYDKQIDLSTVDLKKLRVKELKKILDDWGEMCKGCAEKSDYIRKINELMPKYAPKAASARTDL